MFCPQCGSENDDDAKFCSDCGTEFSTESPTESQPLNTEAPDGPEKKRSPFLAIIAVIGVLFVLAFAVNVGVAYNANLKVTEQLEESNLLFESANEHLLFLDDFDYENGDLNTIHSEIAVAKDEISEAVSILDRIDQSHLDDNYVDRIHAMRILYDTSYDYIVMLDTDLCNFIETSNKFDIEESNPEVIRSNLESMIHDLENIDNKLKSISEDLDSIKVECLDSSERIDLELLKLNASHEYDFMSYQKEILEDLVQEF